MLSAPLFDTTLDNPHPRRRSPPCYPRRDAKGKGVRSSILRRMSVSLGFGMHSRPKEAVSAKEEDELSPVGDPKPTDDLSGSRRKMSVMTLMKDVDSTEKFKASGAEAVHQPLAVRVAATQGQSLDRQATSAWRVQPRFTSLLRHADSQLTVTSAYLFQPVVLRRFSRQERLERAIAEARRPKCAANQREQRQKSDETDGHDDGHRACGVSWLCQIKLICCCTFAHSPVHSRTLQHCDIQSYATSFGPQKIRPV